MNTDGHGLVAAKRRRGLPNGGGGGDCGGDPLKGVRCPSPDMGLRVLQEMCQHGDSEDCVGTKIAHLGDGIVAEGVRCVGGCRCECWYGVLSHLIKEHRESHQKVGIGAVGDADQFRDRRGYLRSQNDQSSLCALGADLARVFDDVVPYELSAPDAGWHVMEYDLDPAQTRVGVVFEPFDQVGERIGADMADSIFCGRHLLWRSDRLDLQLHLFVVAAIKPYPVAERSALVSGFVVAGEKGDDGGQCREAGDQHESLPTFPHGRSVT
jgi:hypothetical protein